MSEELAAIQADFDRIALLSDEKWSHNNHYHDFLLKQLPPRCRRGLDVGCGTGVFSRLLAERCDSVLGLDLSPEMVRIAEEQSRGWRGLRYEVADVTAYPLPDEAFDCIVSIATLHHLPLEATLAQLKRALAPGGTLLVLDLFNLQFPQDLPSAFVSMLVSPLLRLAKNGRLHPPKEVQEAWAAHSPHDHYLTLGQIRAAAGRALPGAQVRGRFFWRYSLVYRKAG